MKHMYRALMTGLIAMMSILLIWFLETAGKPYLCSMNFSGIIVGAAVFFSIGLCHPAVIKMEYYFGKKSWWVWLAVGLACCVLSMLVKNQTVSTIIGGFAFSCLWGIHEMFLQEKRVLRGWFPENPARHEYYESLRRKSD